jgi:hypothetical protein
MLDIQSINLNVHFSFNNIPNIHCNTGTTSLQLILEGQVKAQYCTIVNIPTLQPYPRIPTRMGGPHQSKVGANLIHEFPHERVASISRKWVPTLSTSSHTNGWPPSVEGGCQPYPRVPTRTGGPHQSKVGANLIHEFPHERVASISRRWVQRP